MAKARNRRTEIMIKENLLETNCEQEKKRRKMRRQKEKKLVQGVKSKTVNETFADGSEPAAPPFPYHICCNLLFSFAGFLLFIQNQQL